MEDEQRDQERNDVQLAQDILHQRVPKIRISLCSLIKKRDTKMSEMVLTNVMCRITGVIAHKEGGIALCQVTKMMCRTILRK